MDRMLPLISVCIVGIAICIVVLIVFAWRWFKSFRKRFSKHEVFEMDDQTLTVRLDKKDLHK